MPIECQGNPFKPTGEEEAYDELVGRLWGSFCKGLEGTLIEEDVIEQARTMFKATSLGNYRDGNFGQPGAEDAAHRCCLATGRIARALAEMHQNEAVEAGDFQTASLFVKRLSHGLGSVC